MIFPALLALAGLSEALPQFGGGGSTMLRFGCSQVVIDRIDPLVNPGQAPSPHMHQIVGQPQKKKRLNLVITNCEFLGGRKRLQHFHGVH